MANDPIQSVNSGYSNFTPNFTPVEQPGSMCVAPSMSLPISFQQPAQTSTFGSYVNYAANRILDVAEPIGAAIGRGTDAILGGMVSVGDWWNSFQSNHNAINYSLAGTSGAAEELEIYGKTAGKFNPEISNIGKVGSIVGRGLNALTGGLDLLGAFAQDSHEGADGLRTVTSATKTVATIAAGAAVGAAIFGTFTLAPAIVLGAGAAMATKYVGDKVENYFINTAAPWIRSWF